jgi:hypothetical protein
MKKLKIGPWISESWKVDAIMLLSTGAVSSVHTFFIRLRRDTLQLAAGSFIHDSDDVSGWELLLPSLQ